MQGLAEPMARLCIEFYHGRAQVTECCGAWVEFGQKDAVEMMQSP